MSVRRLAPKELQPGSFAFPAEDQAWLDGQIGKYPAGRQASVVIPLLWRAQKQAGGWLPQAAIEEVARLLDMASIRVLEVATFYTMFNLEPVGRHYIQLCGTTPCGLRGAEELKKVCERRIGKPSHMTPDGLFSWIEVECLGACCNAPMVQINDDYYEDLSPESFDRLLDDLAAGRPVKPGSQTGRASSEPAGAPTTLSDPALYDGSLVGAWRSRFEETRGATAAPAPQAAAESAQAAPSAAMVPKPAKPDAGRPETTAAIDTPAQRAANDERPIDPEDRRHAADRSKRAITSDEVAAQPHPAPVSSRSYVATPSKPDEGHVAAEAPAAGQAASANVGDEALAPAKESAERRAEETTPEADDATGAPPGRDAPRT